MRREDFMAKVEEEFRFDDMSEIEPAVEWVYDALIRPLHDVAHAAWHLMDDSGKLPWDSSLAPGYLHTTTQHDRLSGALDALEAAGWVPCDD